MIQKFAKEMHTTLRQTHVWEILHSVEVLAACSNRLGSVAELELGKRWEVVLTERVGPVRLSAPLAIEIVQEIPLEVVAIEAHGSDRGLNTKLAVSASIACAPNAGGTTLALSGTYEVTGRVASVAAAIVQRQASSMVNEFWDNLRSHMDAQTI